MRFIDGDKLLEWLEVEIDLSSGNSETEKADRWAFGQVRRATKSGRFDVPSNQGTWTHDCREVNDLYGFQVVARGKECPFCGKTEEAK